MKFTFKISYSAMGEAPFQTNTHLSLKKRIKRETQYRIKASNHLFTEQKNRKKKKKKKKQKPYRQHALIN